MSSIGTPLSETAKKVLLCGAGELGKEVAIELQRLGVEVIALDRYPNAPAMQVAHRSHTLSMLDGKELRRIIELEKPDLIVPEIEAIATDTLVELEQEGFHVIPNARATRLTMNREGIRRLAAEELNLKTSSYRFANTQDAFRKAVDEIGIPCVVKPIMSSSGKGQSVIRERSDIEKSWHIATKESRTSGSAVIIEGFIEFDYEITLLTVRHKDGTSFCAPIGHRQADGDYQESWQPHPMSKRAFEEAQHIAGKITDALGGYGVFGVEMFISKDAVIFSEVSPRPHDTGLVTLISQDLSEFALHVRAILGLPIPNIRQNGYAASSVILVEGKSDKVTFSGLEHALTQPDIQLRLFGKPEVNGKRRMGVALAKGESVEDARRKACAASKAVIAQL